ncbi:MAG: carboxylesterase family protein [Lachnospiraceae bacterium]|nr:carboxylesterase family protein [Lachnospiraceae bacterium]
MKNKRSSTGFVIGLTIVTLIFLVLIELSKNTVIGWILTAAAVAGFVLLRRNLVSRDMYYRRPRKDMPEKEPDKTPAVTDDAGKPRKRAYGPLCWLGFLAVLAAIYFISYPPIRQVPAVEGFGVEKTGIIKVAEGELTGVYNRDHTAEIYAGIPYAKAPVGELRWKEPQAPDRYDGVRACDTYGPMAMQSGNGPLFGSLYQIFGFHKYNFSLFDNYREKKSEDCLYLNIYRPADYSGEPLPVVFFIHGGSLTTGQSYYTEYRGDSFAEKGVIFVNFAYRLGVLGYMANEELAAESPVGTTGDYGLLDQIAALKWVHENIAAFGGDPDNITIAGESAGSSSVNALCVSPLTEGLFRRAIAESSSVLARKPYHTFRTMENALKTGRQIMNEFGAGSIAELRDIPAEKLITTHTSNGQMTVDGYAIVEQPYLTYEKGENHEEALLNGFNAKEADAFLLGNKATVDNYVELLKPIVGKYADELAELVPAGSVERDQKFIIDAGGEAKGSLCEVYSAAWFTYSHYLWTNYMVDQGRPVYEYYFTKSNRSLSNFHAGEMPYAYGNLHRSRGVYDSADFELSEKMLNYWVNFAKYGDPNGDGLPVWDPVTVKGGKLLELNEKISMTDDPYMSIYRILDKYQAEQ